MNQCSYGTQLKKVQHTSNLFYTQPDAVLAERLCIETGYRKVFFGNSGAEANEGAIKIARKYGTQNKGDHCNNIITLENSFHGRTVTTLAATGQEVFHQYFSLFTQGFRYVPANNKQAFIKALDDSVCAVMIELVQGIVKIPYRLYLCPPKHPWAFGRSVQSAVRFITAPSSYLACNFPYHKCPFN